MEGFDCYTPLERPAPIPAVAQVAQMPPNNPSEREDGECDTDSSDSPEDELSSSDSELKKRAVVRPKKKRILTSITPAVEEPSGAPQTKKKYNIWTEKIREDALTETMRNFGVNRGGDTRNIEWYDYTLGNRFEKDGKTNRLKRRRSSAGRPREDSGDGEEDGNSMDMDYGGGGKRVCYGKKKQNVARKLPDLEAPNDTPLEEVAKEIARNLKETNEALIVQVTTVLGREFVNGIYKETQRIEEDGGMMIRGNRRRRTSGGVFLFLVKHSDEIDEAKKRDAFKPIADSAEETSKRDEEIEELKKTLITQDSPKMRPRIDAVLNLSNPPPSPVAQATEEEDGQLADEDADNNNNNTSNGGPMNNDHMDYN